MDLHTFDTRLRAVTPEGSRPFLCEGSPLDCSVFLVGLNPRTRTPFWEYWDTSYGCRKAHWLEEYRHREGKLGRTREYLEIIWQALQPIQCLETNLYAAWSNRLADLPGDRRSKEVFDFLLEAIKPRLLFVHGRKAVSDVEKRVGRSLPLGKFHQVRLGGNDTWVYSRHHLSFQLSKSACRKLGKELRDHAISIGTQVDPAEPRVAADRSPFP